MSTNSSIYRLEFKVPSGTSRGVLNDKRSVVLTQFEHNDLTAIGECSVIEGLNPESIEDVQKALKGGFNTGVVGLPSLAFGVEMFHQSLEAKDPFLFFDNEFSRGNKGIPINGLIWMGTKESMFSQIDQKLAQNFRCLKLKIGAINIEDELELLRHIRKHFSVDELELRVDANGAFAANDALEILKRISTYHIHSIEQPIRQGQHQEMAKLCRESPIPIALDEELIGITTRKDKQQFLQLIQPQFIILKPSLTGGWKQSDEWIEIAESLKIRWWATSALESNIGLNAISQWVSSKSNPMPQGLGTGQLYTNNIDSPLEIKDAQLYYNPELAWDFKRINEITTGRWS